MIELHVLIAMVDVNASVSIARAKVGSSLCRSYLYWAWLTLYEKIF